MTERVLRLRIRTVGSEQVTRAVRGITQSARQAARDQQRLEQQTTREAARSAASRLRAAQRADRERLRSAQQESRALARLQSANTRAAERAERERVRAAAQTSRQLERERAREAQSILRFNTAIQRQRSREHAQELARSRDLQSQRRRALGAAGGAALAVAGAGLGRVRGYQSAIGMPTRDELVRTFIDRQRSTIRLAHQAGLSSGDISRRIDRTASRSGVSQESLLEGLEYAQTTLATPDFNALDVFSRHLDAIADASYATGAPVSDLIGALGQMRNQFGITEDDFEDMIGTMASMANNGSIEIGDLAANFTTEMGQFRSLRSGATGEQAAREFAGTAEMIGQALPNDPEGAATQFRALMTSLGQGRTQRGIEAGLRRGGLRERADVFDQEGHLTIEMPELIERMREAGLDGPTDFENAGIRNVRAVQGFQTLLHSTEGGSTQYRDIIGSSSDTGLAMIDETNAELRSSSAGHTDIARAQAEANFQAEGAGVVATMVEFGTGMSELETRFPALAEAASFAAESLSNIGGLAIGARILGFGGAAGGAAAATTALTGGGAGGALGSIGSFLGGVAAPLAAFAGITLTPSVAGGATEDQVGDRRAMLTTSGADEFRSQRASLPMDQADQLRREVIMRTQSGGEPLTRQDIQELARAIGGEVARAVPTPSTTTTPTSTSARRGDRTRR